MPTRDKNQEEDPMKEKGGIEKIVSKEDGDDYEKKQNGDPDNGNEPGENDLVMREGFPALKDPNRKGKYLVDGEEPIPRHPFWSCDDAFQIHPDYLDSLRQDCETVFTARDKPEGQAYSAGQTFFLPANKKPRCALEAIVLSIFQKHVEHVDKGMYSMEHSGVEWWTLVLDGEEENPVEGEKDDEDEEDEVGLHFDADYELEDQATNLLLHPRLGTVTYLSDYGAPTLILDQKSPPMEDTKKTKLEEGIKRAWLSHPKVGKHTTFDGRLLHGAPALFFPSKKRVKGGGEPASKRQRIDTRRYTLLANIWLNHWVLDAALLDDEVCAKLKTPWESSDEGNLKSGEDFQPPFKWNDTVDLAKPTETKKVTLTPSQEDPAGEDEIALCNHAVTVKYNATMQDCHKASALGSTVELELEDGTITLHVGDELPDASDEEADDDA